MNVIAYLGRGIAHEKQGLPCQDAAQYRVSGDGSVVMALSDGAGKAAFALEAAQMTVRSVLDFFTSTMSVSAFMGQEESVQRGQILAAVREALRKHPAFRDTRAGEFSATLSFAVADSRYILCGHLGDGAVYAASASGTAAYEIRPERQGGNSTWFAVSPDAGEHLRMEKRLLRDISGILIISDGPFQMFQNRGGGSASATAHELLTFARQGNISAQRTFARVLNRMAEYPAERLDDWAALLYTRDQTYSPEKTTPVISMLAEENRKYFPQNQPEKPPQNPPRKPEVPQKQAELPPQNQPEKFSRNPPQISPEKTDSFPWELMEHILFPDGSSGHAAEKTPFPDSAGAADASVYSPAACVSPDTAEESVTAELPPPEPPFPA